jgi:hypothetical protein
LKSYQKNAFSGFCQKFQQAMHEVENFFCQFPNPWTLRVSGMGGYTSKCEKSQNHCTLAHTPCKCAVGRGGKHDMYRIRLYSGNRRSTILVFSSGCSLKWSCKGFFKQRIPAIKSFNHRSQFSPLGKCNMFLRVKICTV